MVGEGVGEGERVGDGRERVGGGRWSGRGGERVKGMGVCVRERIGDGRECETMREIVGGDRESMGWERESERE